MSVLLLTAYLPPPIEPVDPLAIPFYLRISPERRRAAWEEKPPQPMPTLDRPVREEDPATRELREQIEAAAARKQEAERERLKALRVRKAAEAAEIKAVRDAARKVRR